MRTAFDIIVCKKLPGKNKQTPDSNAEILSVQFNESLILYVFHNLEWVLILEQKWDLQYRGGSWILQGSLCKVVLAGTWWWSFHCKLVLSALSSWLYAASCFPRSGTMEVLSSAHDMALPRSTSWRLWVHPRFTFSVKSHRNPDVEDAASSPECIVNGYVSVITFSVCCWCLEKKLLISVNWFSTFPHCWNCWSILNDTW